MLEIDVDKIMLEAKTYPVRNVLAFCKSVSPTHPRHEETMATYLILHRVLRKAITKYKPEELLEKSKFII